MSPLFTLALGWLLILVVFLGFLSLLRYLEHRERMAMILRGITPPDKRRARLSKPRLARRTGVLQGGLITAMVGLALVVGLYPLGYILPPALVAPYHLGPWLLAGLIPLAVGLALILGHYLTPGRPIEPVAPEREGSAAQDVGSQAAHTTDQHRPISGSSEPLALPEPRHWTLYRREAAGATQPSAEQEAAENEEADT